MVIARLMGGLGNQMFQYAAARRLAYVLGVDLKLDLTWYKSLNARPYALGAFHIVEDVASPGEIRALTIPGPAFLHVALRKVLGIEFERPKSYIKENTLGFDSSVFSLSDNVYLDGYWQSEKYFGDIQSVIKTDFKVKKPVSERVKRLAKETASCDSVSVHIRRGDYLLEDKMKYHGLCSLDYYRASADIILRKVPNPHFFVFSDDPEWAAENLKVPDETTFIPPSGEDRAFEDQWLIRSCKNHIIANSSFSWWGAWLSENPAKTVIAPRQWFRIEGDHNTDRVPLSWLRV